MKKSKVKENLTFIQIQKSVQFIYKESAYTVYIR